MTEDAVSTVLARFKSETGETVSNMMDLPRNVTVNHLQLICNSLLKQVIMMNDSPPNTTAMKRISRSKYTNESNTILGRDRALRIFC